MGDKIDRKKIRGLIYANGYTITSFAQKCGCTKETMWLFLRGHNPSFRIVRSVVENLELTPEQGGALFFGGTYTA